MKAESSKRKDKIALVKVGVDKFLHPVGILYLGDALKKAGFDVRIFNIFPSEIDRTINDILEIKPLVVAFSTLTGGQTKWTYLMSRAIKKRNKDITIAWGGVHPSMLPEDCLKEDCIDIVCMGEGEELITELSTCLAGSGDLAGIRGIGYKKDREIIFSPPRPFISNIDAYEPDWSLLDNFERSVRTVHRGRRQAEFTTSRGCPYNCGFCYNLKFNDRKWRKHSVEFVLDRIAWLRRERDIRAIDFHDDNFFVDTKRAFYILEKMKEMDVIASRCLIRLDTLNEAVLKELRRLGVRLIFVGWESGTDRILKLVNKGITRQLILEKFELLSRFPDIAVTAASIIGFPTESWDEICQTIDFGVRLAEMVPNINITSQTFMPYPGSSLYELAKKNGFSLPRNMSDYSKFDSYGSQMELSWLPWADKRTSTIFYRIDKYTKLLAHSSGSNIFRTFGKNIFYQISRERLKKKYFAIPWEIPFLYTFNRYYNPKCPA